MPRRKSSVRLPKPGQIVLLDELAGPRFRDDESIYLKLTMPPEPSTVDILAGRSLKTAGGLLLTGWELDHTGRHAGRYHLRLPVRRIGIQIVPLST